MKALLLVHGLQVHLAPHELKVLIAIQTAACAASVMQIDRKCFHSTELQTLIDLVEGCWRLKTCLFHYLLKSVVGLLVLGTCSLMLAFFSEVGGLDDLPVFSPRGLMLGFGRLSCLSEAKAFRDLFSHGLVVAKLFSRARFLPGCE